MNNMNVYHIWRLSCVSTLIIFIACTVAVPTTDDWILAIRSLVQYNFLPNDNVEPGSAVVRRAVKKFQTQIGGDTTGDLDDATLRSLKTRSCDGPIGDMDIKNTDIGGRVRRYSVAQNVMWQKTKITYTVTNHPASMSLTAVQDVFRRAFDEWQNECGLTFTAVDTIPADMVITFFEYYHGDSFSFDGNGNALAHAFLPLNDGSGEWGDIHLDLAEHWVEQDGGTNLFQVVLHEIGHALGLGHSTSYTVMHAFYKSTYDPNFHLTSDDILGAQKLYGKNIASIADTVPLVDVNVPSDNHVENNVPSDNPIDTCINSIDAAATLSDGSTYIFVGQEVYNFLGRKSIAKGYPKSLVDEFGEKLLLFKSIDAAIYWKYENKLYMFVGSLYFRFDGTTLDYGYPKLIKSNWKGVPDNLDAATALNDGSLFFFKGDYCYKYSISINSVESDYPKLIALDSTWNSLANIPIMGASLMPDTTTHLFSLDQYYVVLSQHNLAIPGYPKSAKMDWFGCDMIK